MDFVALRAYLASKPGATEDLPFGPDPLVFKVGGKMFALVGFRTEPVRVSLKCDPFHAQVLREQYTAVQPGYHLNKRHWITVVLDGSMPDAQIQGLIDESYALVVAGLSRAVRQRILTAPQE